jgi:hypothetical protein
LLSLIATPVVFSLLLRSATPEAGRDALLP